MTPGRGAKPPGAPTIKPAVEQPPAREILDESWLERLVKLVPADVVALYVPVLGLRSLTEWRGFPLAVTTAGTLLVPLALFLDARIARERVPPLQYIVRTLAFVAWAFVISDPLGPGVVHPLVPALVALVLPFLGERLLRLPPPRATDNP